MSRLVGLYPRAWRARYGEELEDLVAARPLGFGDAADIIRGALDAHRHPELVDPAVPVPSGAEPVTRRRYEDLRVARRLGQGAMAGAVALLVAPIVALNGPVVFDGDGAYRDGMAAVPFLLAAMVLLSGGLLGQLIRLGPGHWVARTAAILAIVCGPLWAIGPWLIVLWGLALGGLIVFAVAAWWARTLSAAAALTIAASGVACVAIMSAALMAKVDRLQGAGYMALAIVALTPIWLAIGASLQTLPAVIEEMPGSDDTVAETAAA